jgi:hypothetical protein
MTIRRRDLITLLGGAARWPLVAGAQQPGFEHQITRYRCAMPVN